MADPKVTITLGRSGQVVTKGGKHPRGERFGSNGGIFLSSPNKRNRGDGIKFSPGHNGVNGSRISQYDLRLKLMRKRLSKRIPNGVGERKETGPSRKQLTAIQTAASSYMLPQRPDPNNSSLSRQIFPKEIASNSHQMDLFGRFYTPQRQTMGGSGARSPDFIFKSSGRFSSPTSFDGVQQVPLMRMPFGPGSEPYYSNEVYDASRLKARSQSGNQVTRAAPTSGMHRVSHVLQEPVAIAGFLHSLGLEKYAVHFQAEEVDMAVLKQMGDEDLKQMGIPMGPRKKILLALMPRPKRQPPLLQQ